MSTATHDQNLSDEVVTAGQTALDNLNNEHPMDVLVMYGRYYGRITERLVRFIAGIDIERLLQETDFSPLVEYDSKHRKAERKQFLRDMNARHSSSKKCSPVHKKRLTLR